MSDYIVGLLIEQALNDLDARQVLSLHEALPDPVDYVVLLPVDDAAISVETAVSGLGAGEMAAVPPLPIEDVKEIQHDIHEAAVANLNTSVELLKQHGANVTGELIDDDPIAALTERAKTTKFDELIVLTRPHVVAEFFHVDWSARARRKLNIPVLHLIEHETFDDQAGEGEGVTGL